MIPTDRTHPIVTLTLLLAAAELVIAVIYGFDHPIGRGFGLEEGGGVAHRLRMIAEPASSLFLTFAALACAALVCSARELRFLAALAAIHGLLDLYVFGFDFAKRGTATYPALANGAQGAARLLALAVAVAVLVWAMREATAKRQPAAQPAARN